MASRALKWTKNKVEVWILIDANTDWYLLPALKIHNHEVQNKEALFFLTSHSIPKGMK